MSIFSIEPSRKVRRTRFHLNHEVKTTARFGEFTPILCQEVLPGDTWKLSTEQFIRFAPTLAPVMHRINAYLHYFFVPNRLLMRDSWETFISPSGFKDEERAELPYLHFDGVTNLTEEESDSYLELVTSVVQSRLLDHFGFGFAGEWITPQGGGNACCYDGRLKLPLLPICAYWLIMDEFFMDENQNDIRTFKKCLLELCKVGETSVSDLISQRNDKIDYSLFGEDGVVVFLIDLMKLCKRCFEKDYFTSALPDTQRGDEVTLGGVMSVNMPKMQVEVGQEVTSGIAEKLDGTEVGQTGAIVSNALDGDKLYNFNENTANPQTVRVVLKGTTTSRGDVVNENGDPIEDTSVDINPITINELRRAVKLQEFLEKSMRGGYRLIEQIFAHFGVKSSNKLLDRPQFLGGNVNPVTVTEITGTAGTDITHLGEYSGHLQSFGGSRVHKFRSEEHGWLFCFLSVLPRTNYCQGIARQFQRHDRFDFAWPEFAHLGEQEVWMNELYNGAQTELDYDPHETFGYQSRYAEYKYIPSQVSGDFKKENGLAYWTLARRFGEKPTLSNEFLQCSPTDENNTDIFTIQDESDYLYCQFYHKIMAKRCLPKFGVPML